MRFSSGVEQALHILLIFLKVPNQRIGVQEIADYYKISSSYLSKVLSKLTKAGILRSVTGVAGGYLLAKDPNNISFWNVIEAIEGKGELFQCTNLRFNSADTLTFPHEMLGTPCLIHSVFVDAEQWFRETLQSKTLAQLFKEYEELVPELFQDRMVHCFQK